MSKVDTRKLGTHQAMTHCTVEYYPHYLVHVPTNSAIIVLVYSLDPPHIPD